MSALPEHRFIPGLNEPNKELQTQVHTLERDVAGLETNYSHVQERVGVMSDHVKNVSQELQQTRALCDARKRELETDDHMKILAQQEQGRLEKEMRRLENEMADLRAQVERQERDLRIGNTKAVDMRSQMSLQDQAQKLWLDEARRRDADAQLLQKYAAADDARTKDLQVKMERAEEECQKRRVELEKEVTENMSSQIALDRTSEQFRAVQVERKEMLKQWESTVQQMKRRDEQIDSVALAVAEQKSKAHDVEMQLKERRWFLEQEEENNNDEERQVQRHEKSVARARVETQQAMASTQQMGDELETLKFTVDKLASDERSTRAEVSRLKQDVAEKKAKLAVIQTQCAENRHQLEASTVKTLDSENVAQDIEVLIAEKEESLRQLQKELDKQHAMKFKRSQELFELRGNRENVKAELLGAKFAYRNVGSKLRKVDDEMRKQSELIYLQDFTIQELDGRTARLEGDRTNDEKVQLNKQIEDLKARWEDQKTVQTVLTGQLKKINDDIRRLTTYLEKFNSEKQGLEGKVQDVELHNENAERELRKTVNNKQDQQVECNILKLSLKNRRRTMNNRVDQVLGLESRQLEMQTAMSERRMDIRNHQEVLNSQLRSIQTEKGRLTLELHERESRLDKLKKRYEIKMVQMAGPGGEEGDSHVTILIKKAQEKEELQRAGDVLDAKIRKGEKELIAMENTLTLLGRSNNAYRRSLNPSKPHDKEVQEVERLQAQLDAAAEKFKMKKKQYQETMEDTQRTKDMASELAQKEAAIIEQIGSLKSQYTFAKKERDEQAEKKERAERMVVKAKKDLRQKNKDGFPEMEKDINARLIRDFNLGMMETLGKLAKDEPNLTDTIHMLCSQMDLPAPPAPIASGGSRGGSLAGSRQSSVASDRSSRASSLSSSRSSVSGVVPSGRVTKIAFEGDSQSGSSRSVGRAPPGALRKSSSSRSASTTPLSLAKGSARKL